jgi:hypothetical protein
MLKLFPDILVKTEIVPQHYPPPLAEGARLSGVAGHHIRLVAPINENRIEKALWIS